MHYLHFALLTVVCWGTYGVCMHIGSSNMADKENGRIMAFLWVGLAYFPDRSDCSVNHPEIKRGEHRLLDLSDKGLAMVSDRGNIGRDWCTWEYFLPSVRCLVPPLFQSSCRSFLPVPPW